MKTYFTSLLLLLLIISYRVEAQSKLSNYFTHVEKPNVAIPEDVCDSIPANESIPDSVSAMLHFKRYRVNMDFNNAIFQATAQFYTSIFYQDANFKNAEFKGNADFSFVTFKRDANFNHTSFNKILFMSGIRADTIAVLNFYNARLPDLIDFSHVKNLGRIVDFTDANLDTPKKRADGVISDTRIFINLFDSDFSKLKLDYLHFRLCFYDPNRGDEINGYLTKLFDSYEIRKGKRKKDTLGEFNAVYSEFIQSGRYNDYIRTIFPSVSLDDKVVIDFTQFYYKNLPFPARLTYDQTEAVYSRILKNFDGYGQKMSYESCDIDRNKFISKFWNLSRYWNRWGYHNEYIFYWTAGLLLLFTIFTFIFYKPLLLNESPENRVYLIDNFPDPTLSGLKKATHRWRCSFIYTSIIFFAFALKLDKLNYRRGWVIYVVIVNAIGLLCLGYLANFILQK